MNVFFLGSWGNESERGTNKSREHFFQHRLFLKLSEKGYKFKVPTVMGTLPHLNYESLCRLFAQMRNYFLSVDIGKIDTKQNRSTEGCSKLKRSVDMTSSGKNGLNIRTNASPKWDRTRCPEE